MQLRLSQKCNIVKRSYEPTPLNLEVWVKVETLRDKIHAIAASGLDEQPQKQA